MMKNYRMSKKVHEVPRRDTMGGHPSGKAGNTGLDNGQQLEVIKKTRAFKSSTGGYDEWVPTGTPKSAEDVDQAKEGGVHVRTAHKNQSKLP